MRKQDIKRHLQDYSILNKRKTTINHAFASALSISDLYDESKIDLALKILGQDPDNDLICVYCGNDAETWDHIKAVVNEKEFSGYGHRINNLLPCCKKCNSKKGNKDWMVFLHHEGFLTQDKVDRINKYISLDSLSILETLKEECSVELIELNNIKFQIFELMKIGDEKAKFIREKIREKINNNGK